MTLERTKLAPEYTEGKLYIDGEYYCDTLEREYDPVLSCVEGSGKCIPFTGDEALLVNGSAVDGPGDLGYPIVMSWSPYFRRLMPTLCDVPGRSRILIHKGNVPRDTKGCILVGTKSTAYYLKGGVLILSQRAFDPLYARIAQAYKRGEPISIRVVKQTNEAN